LIDGKDLEAVIARLFGDARAAYLHIHFASPGCHAARGRCRVLERDPRRGFGGSCSI
jgi:hypothetical protein